MIVLRNCDLYSPKYLGRKDVIISQNKIEYVCDSGLDVSSVPFEVEEIDASGRICVPGFIDIHQHITGGGGEGGFGSRVPELSIKDEIVNGVTTVLGLVWNGPLN